MSALADRLARLTAAIVEARAAVIDLGSWLVDNGEAQSDEIHALSTVETASLIADTANGVTLRLARVCGRLCHNATVLHGRAAVSEAIQAGKLAAAENCPCPQCAPSRAAAVIAAQTIHAAALAAPTGEPS